MNNNIIKTRYGDIDLDAPLAPPNKDEAKNFFGRLGDIQWNDIDLSKLTLEERKNFKSQKVKKSK